MCPAGHLGGLLLLATVCPLAAQRKEQRRAEARQQHQRQDDLDRPGDGASVSWCPPWAGPRPVYGLILQQPGGAARGPGDQWPIQSKTGERRSSVAPWRVRSRASPSAPRPRSAGCGSSRAGGPVHAPPRSRWSPARSAPAASSGGSLRWRWHCPSASAPTTGSAACSARPAAWQSARSAPRTPAGLAPQPALDQVADLRRRPPWGRPTCSRRRLGQRRQGIRAA